jgi:DNA topoisomerase I
VADNLVIVESPAKAKTIQRYLGAGYEVLASYGHIRDLPRSDFAVELGNGGGLPPQVRDPGQARRSTSPRSRRRKGKDTVVWLATDLDREGEAIAWHLAEVLGLDLDQTNRVTFDEITKDAIPPRSPRRAT